MSPREFLRQMFTAAIASAQPEHCIPRCLPEAPPGRTVVIGAGKASAAMAAALERHWPDALECAPAAARQPPEGMSTRLGAAQRRLLSGLVVTRYGYAVPCERIEIVEAAHPVPDAAGQAAAGRMIDLVQGLSADDLVICLVSGGGSALLPLPGEGVSLEDKQAINRALLKSGATISEMNCLRRHFSAIKGGRLAAACHPARVVNLLISDVPGDNPMDIASGPTVADPTTCRDALEIVRRYAIDLPAGARRLLESGAGETVKPGDPRLARVSTHLVATPQMALEAAAAVARAAGITPVILGDAIEGEARDVGKVMAGIALQVRHHRQPAAALRVALRRRDHRDRTRHRPRRAQR